MFDVLLWEVIYMLQQKRKLQRPNFIYFNVVNIDFFIKKMRPAGRFVTCRQSTLLGTGKTHRSISAFP